MIPTSTLQVSVQPDLISALLYPLVVGLVVGLVLYFVTNKSEKRKFRASAIYELMTYRGDFTSTEFRRALNRVAIVFHDQEEIRKEIRKLYEVINSPSGGNSEHAKRAIVGLIYTLCQKNHFKGLSEYDIDQAFPETRQAPSADADQPTALPPAAPSSHPRSG